MKINHGIAPPFRVTKERTIGGGADCRITGQPAPTLRRLLRLVTWTNDRRAANSLGGIAELIELAEVPIFSFDHTPEELVELQPHCWLGLKQRNEGREHSSLRSGHVRYALVGQLGFKLRGRTVDVPGLRRLDCHHVTMIYVRVTYTVADRWTLIDPQPYLSALPGFLDELPPGAARFASDADHYDFYSERCVKDLKLCHLEYEPTNGSMDICATFRFNDVSPLELKIDYRNVSEFEVQTFESNPVGRSRLGELILDEILPASAGFSQEFAMHGGRVWVVAEDLESTWTHAVRSPHGSGDAAAR